MSLAPETVPTLDRLRASLLSPTPAPARTDCDSCDLKHLAHTLYNERAAQRLLHARVEREVIAPVDRVGCPYPRVRATGTTFQHQSHHWVHRASYYLEGAMVQAFVCSNQSPGGSRACNHRMTLSTDVGGADVCPSIDGDAAAAQPLSSSADGAPTGVWPRGDGEEASIAFMEHAQAMYRLQDTPNLFRLYEAHKIAALRVLPTLMNELKRAVMFQRMFDFDDVYYMATQVLRAQPMATLEQLGMRLWKQLKDRAFFSA